MKLKLPRRRWLLLIACLAVAIAVIGWLQLSGPRGRFTREQYDRIRLGMTRAEVSQIMGPASPAHGIKMGGPHEIVAEEGSILEASNELWQDRSVQIWVFYHDGKASQKQMLSGVPPWKEWLDWLMGKRRQVVRQLVGW